MKKIINPKNFDEWMALARQQRLYEVHRVTIGSGGKHLVQVVSPKGGTIGLWNHSDGCGFIEVEEKDLASDRSQQCE